ncbi:MAG: YdeI/OmpD-associated family protein [archaeon]
MEISKTIYLIERKDWRKWLARNHDKEKDIWLVYYRKSSGKPRISYNDAVEEAICYGWIDGIVKGIDEERFAQRFSPRRKKSNLSAINRERIADLIENGKMTEFGMKAIEGLFDEDYKMNFIIPQDILYELQKDKQTWEKFQGFSERYKRIRIEYIEMMRNRNRKEFDKRLNYFAKMTRKNKQFGFVKEMV